MKKPPPLYDKAAHEARKYWRARLEAMPFDAHVAPDHPRPVGPADGPPRPSSLEQVLDPDAHALLRGLTGGDPFLSYTALLLALQICCFRYSGISRVTIFSPVTEGAAADWLPIDAMLEERATFQDALLATKDLLAGAYRHQQYALSRMVLDLREERRPRHLPMVASMAGLHGALPDERGDLVVRFEPAAERTRVALHFDGRLYEASTVRRFFEAFERILRRGLRDTARPIAELWPEEGRGLEGPGDAPGAPGAADGAAGVLLHRLIAARAAEHPERVAVVQGDRATTYEALLRDAARLASVLAELSLDAGRPVVLLMDAGAELSASMLAVLELGAAFAPIKLLSTRGPIAGLLDALGAECVICQRGYAADLPPLGDGIAHVITVERGAPAGGGEAPLEIARHRSTPRTAPRGEAAADGRPGVACVIADDRGGTVARSAVTHAELARLFRWLGERCRIGGADRCLLSPALEVCEQLHDLLGMLAAGASVEIPDAASLKDTAVLAAKLMAPEITVWDLPAPLMQNLLPALLALRARPGSPPGPRHILLTGEAQSARLLDRLARAFPDARLTGLYAHPEVGIWSTAFSAGEEPAELRHAIIARPLPGFEHRVVNGGGAPALLHTRGELYLHRAPAPEAEPPPAVRTGLRAELLGGGRVRWLRGDEHVVVERDCRVELTTIEAALCEHAHVRAAEVIAASPEPGAGRRVVAFVLADPADPDRALAAALRDFLDRRGGVDVLPDPIVVIDELPLTAAGAIDRAALLGRIAAARGAEAHARGAELGQIQAKLKELWLEILQLDEIGDDDSFFTRGGNSLRATLLLARIEDELSVELSVQQFFREPSIRAVAQLIAAGANGAAGAPKGAELKVVSRDQYRAQVPDPKP